MRSLDIFVLSMLRVRCRIHALEKQKWPATSLAYYVRCITRRETVFLLPKIAYFFFKRFPVQWKNFRIVSRHFVDRFRNQTRFRYNVRMLKLQNFPNSLRMLYLILYIYIYIYAIKTSFARPAQSRVSIIYLKLWPIHAQRIRRTFKTERNTGKNIENFASCIRNFDARVLFPTTC